MKRSALALSLVLFGAAPVVPFTFGQQADVTKLETQKAELSAKVKDLQKKVGEIRQKIAASDATAAERKAVADAKKACEDKLAADPEMVKARAAEKEAQARLHEIIAAKVAASPEQVAAAKANADLAAKRSEILHTLKLIDYQLNDDDSPIVAAAEADGEVKALKEKLVAAQKELAENPSPAVASARKAVADAAAAIAKASQEPAIALAAKAAADASEALRDARAKDPKAETAKKAHDALAAARDKKLADMPEAKPLIDENLKLTAQLADFEKAGALCREMLEIYGEAANGKAVADVKAKVESAKKARDAAFQSAGVVDLGRQLREAQTARDAKADALLAKDEKYTAMKARCAAAKDTVTKLSAKLSSLSEAEVKQLAQARIDMDNCTKGVAAACRGQWRKPEVQAAYEAAHKLYSEYGEKSRPAAAAGAAVRAAEKELSAVLEAQGAASKSAKATVDQLAALSTQIRDARFKIGLNNLKLNDKDGAVARACEADGAVAAAAKAAADADKAAKESPAIVSAEKKSADASAALKSAHEASAAWKQASAASAAAQKAMKDATAADPKKAALDQAQAAFAKAREAKIEASSAAAPLIAQRKAIADQQKNADKARSEAASAATANAKKLQDSDDPAIVAQKKAIADTQKKLKEIPAGEALVAAKKKISDAESALQERVKTLVASDTNYQAIQKDLDAANQQGKDIDGQIRAAKKPAPKAPATQPAKKNGK